MHKKYEPGARELRRMMLGHRDIQEFIDRLPYGLVIAVGVLKGGTGKSTLVLYLALWWAWMCGRSVCVVDTDDNSQSISNWFATHTKLGSKIPFAIREHDVGKAARGKGPSLEQRLAELRKEFDIVIVDLGGGDRETFGDACEYANLLYMPVAPSGWETSRLEATRMIAEKHGRFNEYGLVMTVVITRCDFGTTLAEEARARLEDPIEGKPFPVPHRYFDISQAPHHVRAWEVMPKRRELEEEGLLMKHVLKDVVGMMEGAEGA